MRSYRGTGSDRGSRGARRRGATGGRRDRRCPAGSDRGRKGRRAVQGFGDGGGIAYRGNLQREDELCGGGDVVQWAGSSWVSLIASNAGRRRGRGGRRGACSRPQVGRAGAVGRRVPGLSCPAGRAAGSGLSRSDGAAWAMGRASRVRWVRRGQWALSARQEARGWSTRGPTARLGNYSLGDVVVFQGSSYVSLTGFNVGQTPGLSPAYWGVLTAQGPAGATGATGAAGPMGAQGLLGPVGPPGSTGAQGAQGIAGEAGGQGIPGVTGVDGPVGADGAAGRGRAGRNELPGRLRLDQELCAGGWRLVAGCGVGIADRKQPREYAEHESGRLGDVCGQWSSRRDRSAGSRRRGGTEWARRSTRSSRARRGRPDQRARQEAPGWSIGALTARWGTTRSGTWSSSMGRAGYRWSRGTSGRRPGLARPYWGVLTSQGAQGVAGPTGATGSLGPAGPQGMVGAAGPAGVAGPIGIQGPAGAQGLTGRYGVGGIGGPARLARSGGDGGRSGSHRSDGRGRAAGPRRAAQACWASGDEFCGAV